MPNEKPTGSTIPNNLADIPPATASRPIPPELDDDWLQNFYKEAGREATLAYTTLNQMKNWAMVVAAAALSGLPFGSKSADYPTPIMFAGTVIVYTLILRFFVRAMLCYINLIRWNVLQNDCIQLKLLPSGSSSLQDRERKLRTDIQHYYFEWLSPLTRKDQIFENLKLGFYLLFALVLFFMVWGAIVLWQSHFVMGLLTFAVLNTALEAWDFMRSKYFDNPVAWHKRMARGKAHDIFPIPRSHGTFLLGWLVNLVVSVLVALWPELRLIVGKLCS